VVRHDRGMHVRPSDQYVALCGRSFPHQKATIDRGYSPLPYTICVVEATRARV
jgi:hypothetical protein